MNEEFWVGAIHAEMTDHLPVTVTETGSFYTDALQFMTDEDLIDLKMKLATNPDYGRLIPDTGGVRHARLNIGKSGNAVRILYLYRSSMVPIFLLGVEDATQEIELTTEEKAQIRDYVGQLLSEYSRKRLQAV